MRKRINGLCGVVHEQIEQETPEDKKQKRGKKRMKQIGNVEVPQKAFLAVLKLD